METIQSQVNAEDAADQIVVDWKKVGVDVHYNGEAHIFLADEELGIVELGVWDRDWMSGNLPERSADCVVVKAVHSD